MPTIPSPRVLVRLIGDHHLVEALVPIAAGDRVLEIEGELTKRPSRYSLQLDDGVHIEVPSGQDHAVMLRHSPWRFLNHACAPNAAIAGRRLVALVAIAKGAEVTFDYNTTEYAMAAPFPCRCGDRACLGIIRGFRFLTMSQREQRLQLLAPHLLRRLGEVPSAPEPSRG